MVVALFRLVYWNMRTVYTGMPNDLEEVNDPKKSTVIDRELEKFDVDIATLSKTKLAETGSLHKMHYTFFSGMEKAKKTTANCGGFCSQKLISTLGRMSYYVRICSIAKNICHRRL